MNAGERCAGCDVQARCPGCGVWVDDLDGFGVLVHDACGYCEHPDAHGDVCQACGATIR